MTDYTFTPPFVYQHGGRDIINSVSFSVDQRKPDGQLSTVWTSDDTIVVEPGQTIQVDMQASEPFMDVTSVNVTFTGSTTLTATTNRFSGQSIQVNVHSTGGTAIITHMELIARSVPVVRTVKVTAQDSVSIAQHGQKDYPNTAPWAGVEDARAIAGIVLAHYAQRRPTVDMRVTAQDPDHLRQILSRRISDLITIRNGELGLSADFHIESIAHTVQRIDPDKGPVHAVVFGCERNLTASSNNPFTFDKAGAGFDDGFFGVAGLDDPSTVFIFDHPTQGQFDVGLFGT